MTHTMHRFPATLSAPQIARRALTDMPRWAVAVGVVAILLLIALAAGRLLPGAPPIPPDEPVAFLELSRGAVQVLPPSSGQDPSRLLALGGGSEPIRAGSTLDTRAMGDLGAGHAALRLVGGQSVRLDRDSRIRLVSGTTLELERGAVYVDSDTASALGGSGVEVRTTLGVVRDIGTQFEVRLLTDDGGAVRVRVREGEITLERNGSSHLATAGEQLTFDAAGDLRRVPVAIHGDAWQWVLDAAPAPEIEGRPLREVLDWIVREGGWTLRFADDATAEHAAGVTLHGDAAGLTVDEVAAMVLRGSGLDFRVEKGELVVSVGESV